MFASQAIERGGCRMLRGGQHGQHSGPMAVGVALSSTEDALAVLPQYLEAANSTSAGPRGWIHMHNPPSGQCRYRAERYFLKDGHKDADEKRITHPAARRSLLLGTGVRNRSLRNRNLHPEVRTGALSVLPCLGRYCPRTRAVGKRQWWYVVTMRRPGGWTP